MYESLLPCALVPVCILYSFSTSPPALCSGPSFFWCQWVQLWPLFPVRLICCPFNHPHFSLFSCSLLPEPSLLSQSHYLTPCSFSHICVVLSAFLHSFWIPALSFCFFLTAAASCLLQHVFLSLCSTPLPLAALLSLHIWQHIQTTVLAPRSISQRVSSRHLSPTAPPLPTSTCYTQGCCYKKINLAKRIYILMFGLGLAHVGKSYLVNSRKHVIKFEIGDADFSVGGACMHIRDFSFDYLPCFVIFPVCVNVSSVSCMLLS